MTRKQTRAATNTVASLSHGSVCLQQVLSRPIQINLVAVQHTTQSPSSRLLGATTSAMQCVTAIAAFIIFQRRGTEKPNAKATTLVRITMPERLP